MPNPLVRALANLDDAAQLGLPWVEELAADIFVGQLGAKFHHAARLAADLLGDSLYARYYELPFERVLALPEPTRPRKGPTLAPELLALAGALAGRDVGEREGSPSARNGVLLEHVQLLTTHNLATMLHPRGLDLRSALQAELGELALRSVEWIGERLRRDPGAGHWRPRLHMIKNVAYAWRQLIVLLSLADASEQAHVLARARASLPAWPVAWAGKFERVLLGLELVHAGRAIADEPRARRLLGWSLGRHWLLDHAA